MAARAAASGRSFRRAGVGAAAPPLVSLWGPYPVAGGRYPLAFWGAGAAPHGRELRFGFRTHVVVRETEAEAVAFVVCQAIGLETGTAASDYIQLFDGKAETLAASLDRIQKTAAEIIAAVHAELAEAA